MLARKVLIRRLVEGNDELDGAIDERNEVRKRVAEEAADPQRDVDPGSSQPFERDHREVLNPPGLRIPDGLHAQQRQHLRDVVALRPHLRRAPGAEPDHLGVAALFREMAREHLAGELLADPPRRLRRNRPRIDGIEIPAGGQDVRHAARRRTGGARRNVATGQRIEHVVHFVGHQLQRRHERAAGETQAVPQSPRLRVRAGDSRATSIAALLEARVLEKRRTGRAPGASSRSIASA